MLALLVVACGEAERGAAPVAASRAKLISGRDDRTAPAELADQVFAVAARGYVAALVESELVVGTPGSPVLDGMPLYEWHEVSADVPLCRDERFALEPTPAFCSGTLIAPDLLLTAGHCIVTTEDCEATAVVFGFEASSAGVVPPLRAQDIYACDEVLAWSGPDDGDADYALVRLDREVPDREPSRVVLDERSLPVGTQLIMAGHPIGLPLKITPGGRVRPSPLGYPLNEPNYFGADIDTFPGNSGSGGYLSATDAPQPLVGVLSSVVSRDSYVFDERRGCDRYERYAAVDVWLAYSHHAIAALCEDYAGSYPELCGCGDGSCSAAAGEDGTTCATDCGDACGDDVCLGDETDATCAADCGVCGDGICSTGEACCNDCGCADGFACAAERCTVDPQPHDGRSCSEAIELVIANGAASASGSTAGWQAAVCENDPRLDCTGPERHYAFTLAQPAAIVAVASGYQHIALALRDAPCSGGRLIAGAVDRTGAGSTRVRHVLQPGSYVLRVDGERSYDSGNYELAMTFQTPPVGRGDSCSDPIPLTPTGAYSLAGDTRDAPFGSGPTGGCATPTFGNDRVYGFTLTQKTRVETAVDAAHDASLVLMRATGASLCGEALRCEPGASGIRRVLDPGAYLLIVDGEQQPDSGPYMLSLEFTASPVREGESCEDALVLEPSGQQQLTGDVSSFQSDIDPPCSDGVGPDRVYTFTLSEPRTVRIEAVGAAGAIIDVSTQCPLTDGAECFALSAVPQWQNRNLAAGTYFIVIDGSDAAGGAYDIAIDFESEPLGQTCFDALPLTIGSSAVTVTGTGHPGASSTTLHYGFTLAQASQLELSVDDPATFWLSSAGQTVYRSSGELATSVPAGTYCVQLSAPLGSLPFELSASAMPLAQPEGRGCGDAIALTPSGAHVLDGFATFGVLAGCSTFPAQVYAFELTEPTVVRATAGSAFALAVYRDDACTDLASCTAGQSSLEESFDAGHYKLAVAGPPYSDYALEISFNCAPDSEDDACSSIDAGPEPPPDASMPEPPDDAAVDAGGEGDSGEPEPPVGAPDASVDGGSPTLEPDAALPEDDGGSDAATGEPSNASSGCACSVATSRAPADTGFALSALFVLMTIGRLGRSRVRLIQILVGVALGLALVEAAFWMRDGGAFPHLNVYVEDAALGVRLRPHATQRFKLGANPPSEVRINGLGLRGAELPPPSADEILVLGDSQAFGLGVEEHEAFAARLAQLVKRPVVNAGIPTYGPIEYNAFAAELIAQRKPKLVIYTVNMLNDLFEHARPNKDRHRVWDGWAVRSETAPGDMKWFPGRELLYRESHAVYALRRYLHAGETRPAQTLVSEGLAADLFVASSTSAQQPTAASALLVENAAKRGAQVSATEQAAQAREDALAQARSDLERANVAPAAPTPRSRKLNEARYVARQTAEMAAAHPGDIVYESGAESARPVTATAALIRDAARERARALAIIEASLRDELEALKANTERRAVAASRLRQLSALKYDQAQPASVLEPRLREIRAIAAKHGAEVLVVALPIDVQVSSTEWKKYGAPVTEMAPTLALTSDMLESARSLGMRALDTLPALRAASPGAFLHGDIHMTRKGHDAVAKAIAAAMKQPVPERRPQPGLPAGRTYPFVTLDDFGDAQEIWIERAEEAGCTVHVQDEWAGVVCVMLDETPKPPHIDARVLSGGHGEVVIRRGTSLLQLRAPVLAGEKFRARIEWEKASRELELERAAGGAWSGRFSAAVPGNPSGTKLGSTDTHCVCDYNDVCEIYVPDRPECRPRGDEAAEDPCDAYYRCAFGERAAWRPCPAGHAHGDPSGRCLPLCDADGGCVSGRCESWQGVDICRPAL